MKRSTAWMMGCGLALTLALGGCRKSETAVENGSTQTIEPARPQPDLSGTDAMTQTVDVEKGRSEAEGHGTEAAAASATETAATATTTTTTTMVPPAPPTTTTR